MRVLKRVLIGDSQAVQLRAMVNARMSTGLRLQPETNQCTLRARPHASPRHDIIPGLLAPAARLHAAGFVREILLSADREGSIRNVRAAKKVAVAAGLSTTRAPYLLRRRLLADIRNALIPW
jgi:hypothetical protein